MKILKRVVILSVLLIIVLFSACNIFEKEGRSKTNALVQIIKDWYQQKTINL